MSLRKVLSFSLLGACVSGIAAVSWVQSQALNAQTVPPTEERSEPAPSPTASPIPEKPSVPYVPTPERVVSEMLKLAEVNNTDVVYDLGSGDGRLVITAIQQFGAQRGVGVEINPGLVRQSRENAEKAGVSDRAQFLQQDLFKADFREASVVTLYLLPEVNLKLRPKLLNELKPGTRIVSHAFTMGDWKPDKTFLVPDPLPQRILYYWVVPAKVAGDWKGSLAYAPGRSYPYTLRFSQQYQQVKGDVIVDGQKIPISNIKLVGDRLTFSRTDTVQGQKMTVVFKGQVQGNSLKGIAELQGGLFSRSFPIAAQRTTTQQQATK